MPHKQPQICDTGCCTQEDVDCCVLAKRADMGTYTYSQLTAGPGAKGPYESFGRLQDACNGFGDTSGLPYFTYPAMTDASKVIDYDSHGCTHIMGQFVCGPGSVDPFAGFALCSECINRFLIGVFLVPDEVGPPLWSCGPYDLGHKMAARGGGVEWYCVDGAYHRRVSITATYNLYLRVGRSDSCGSLLPDLIDGVDYTWSKHNKYSWDWQAVRNDGKAGVILNEYNRWSSGQYVHVTAWTYEDDADTVSLWNDPYDPLDWFHGTFSLI